MNNIWEELIKDSEALDKKRDEKFQLQMDIEYMAEELNSKLENLNIFKSIGFPKNCKVEVKGLNTPVGFYRVRKIVIGQRSIFLKISPVRKNYDGDIKLVSILRCRRVK